MSVSGGMGAERFHQDETLDRQREPCRAHGLSSMLQFDRHMSIRSPLLASVR